KKILPAQISQHGGGAAVRGITEGITDFGGHLVQHGRPQQEILHVGRLAGEHFAGQDLEQAVQRAGLVQQRFIQRGGGAAAQALPDHLQRDRPALCGGYEFADLIRGQFVAVVGGKQGGDLCGGKGQVRLVDHQHFALGTPARQVGELDRRASRQNDVQRV